MVFQLSFFARVPQTFGVAIKELIEISTMVDLTEEGGTIQSAAVPVVNVLHLVQYLFADHGISIPQQTVTRYWQHARARLPWGAQHPSRGLHVPLALHGDEARYTNGKGCVEKVVVLNLSCPLWRPKSARNSRFVLFSLRESLSLGHRTLWPIFQYLTWALNILFLGVKVSSDFRGKKLPKSLQRSPDHHGEADYICRGLQFALTELRGDWSWHCDALQLRNRWNSNSMCFRCRAKAPRAAATNEGLGATYLDYSKNPGWELTKVSHIEFLNTMLRPGPICAFGCNGEGHLDLHHRASR